MRVLEVVLMEMEAAQEIMGGLGKGALAQEVGEKPSNTASCGGWLLYLQEGNLLLVYTGEQEWEVRGTPTPLPGPPW